MESIMLQTQKMRISLVVFTLAFGLALTGCDSTSDSGDTSSSDINLQFATPNLSSSKAKVPTSNQNQKDSDTLSIEGSNGTLDIHELQFVVEEFELEKADGECADTLEADKNNCEDFEIESFFVNLPLSEDTLNMGKASVEPGQYEELEFEIDNLDGEDLMAMRDKFSDWPEESSMRIQGEFISNGDTTAFKTFAEAEIELEMEFNRPLEVGENTVNNLLRVNINPEKWFLRNDDSVIDLSQYNYEDSGKTLEFDVDIEDGFEGVEVDEDFDLDD